MIENHFIEVRLRQTDDEKEVVIVADGDIVYRATFTELTIRDKGWTLEIKGGESE